MAIVRTRRRRPVPPAVRKPLDPTEHARFLSPPIVEGPTPNPEIVHPRYAYEARHPAGLVAYSLLGGRVVTRHRQ